MGVPQLVRDKQQKLRPNHGFLPHKRQESDLYKIDQSQLQKYRRVIDKFLLLKLAFLLYQDRNVP